MKKLYKGFLALITVGFLSAPTIAAPVELHYWHGHTGKLEAIINEIADRWNASQDESMLMLGIGPLPRERAEKVKTDESRGSTRRMRQ